MKITNERYFLVIKSPSEKDRNALTINNYHYIDKNEIGEEFWGSDNPNDNVKIVFAQPLVSKFQIGEKPKFLNSRATIKNFTLKKVDQKWEFVYECNVEGYGDKKIYENQFD